MNTRIDNFFSRYVEAYNRALVGDLDTALIRSFFSKTFLAAGPTSVNTGKNGFLFSLVLKRAYAFYRKIGTKHLAVLRTDTTAIDPNHSMTKVFYRADYEKNGKKTAIDFDVTYLLEHHGEDLKIFAFVAGDEMKAYKDAGLV